ncbi:hypothetical protein A2U01_0105677, partial [Trifolium medium]|nr:hypothetical protein [Trifolium medium]
MLSSVSMSLCSSSSSALETKAMLLFFFSDISLTANSK